MAEIKSSEAEEIAGWVDGPPSRPHDPDDTDPKLLRDNSEIRAFETSRFAYPGIRVFYRQHPRAGQLPRPPLPLLVFVHGLGGSVAQFHPLLTSLVHLSSCLAIDLPGCGRSKFDPADWGAYSFDALIELLDLIIDEYRQKEDVEGTVVLVGQSLGGALSARLASTHQPGRTRISNHVVGYVGICPVTKPPPAQKVTVLKTLLSIPDCVFNLWRSWDQWGGPDSASVSRFVGNDASPQLRKLQERFNKQSRSGVFRRMAWGSIPTYEGGLARGGICDQGVWAGLQVPAFLVAGEADHITLPQDISKMEEFMSASTSSLAVQESIGEAAEPISESLASPSTTSKEPVNNGPTSITDIRVEDFIRDKRPINLEDSTQDDPSTPDDSGQPEVPSQPRHPHKMVKLVTMPAPANHALIYMPSTVRILAGLISEFLHDHVTNRLSLGWQLQYLSREGKWDVKNLEKWRKVAPVSAPIGRPGAPIFRAMKTLREVDDVHSPIEFVKAWGGVILDVIDISHDQPVYDPLTMEHAGIAYHKFATVSKIPPRDAEVESFVQLVDRIRGKEQFSSDFGRNTDPNDDKKPVIGVHCHYGFNRTGYFLVCYLVERCGYGVQEAIETFAAARPNGIRHTHFLDQLFVRYSGLKRDEDGA